MCTGEQSRAEQLKILEISHRSVGSLLAAVFARPAPQLGVARGALHVDAVDDVEELLHHGHLLKHELNLPLHVL